MELKRSRMCISPAPPLPFQSIRAGTLSGCLAHQTMESPTIHTVGVPSYRNNTARKHERSN